jgi:uncharacterized protein (TIGR02099 family)
MQKIKFSMRNLLVRLSIIILSLYLIAFTASMITTGIMFISLNHYKDRIEKFIMQKTGFIVNIKNIHTKLNNNYLPELTLDDLSIINSKELKQQIKLKQVNVILSYASIWNFSLIFKKIGIANSALSIEYLPNGNIVVNGILINEPNTNINKNQKSSFDFENWLLKQKEITLQNIQLSFWDKKNNLPQFTLHNISLDMSNSIFGEHSINLNISNNFNKNNFITNLKWSGEKIENYKNWKSANLTVQTYDDQDLFSKKLGKYLPKLKMMDKYSAKTALIADMKNGRLNSIHANFDIKNFSYILAKNKSIIAFPNIGGKVDIKLDEDTNTYSINAQNLRFLTSEGYLLNNKQVTGFYIIDKQGAISISDTNLKNLNNIISIIPLTKDLSISGNLNLVTSSWSGNIFHPTDYTLNVKFANIGINSANKNIPSINNVSGDMSINKESGLVNLNLKNSTLNYKYMFYVPYEIKNASSIINWQKQKDQTIIFNLLPTKIQAKDFNANAYGKYIYKANTTGYLELYANLDKVAATRIGYYLPTELDNANQWLQMALKDGYATHCSLKLKGRLDDFPFQNGKGIFYIDSDIENAKLLYVKGWPTIDNVFGKFMIRNQKIIITTTKAKVNNNKILNAHAEIPDMTADFPYLTAIGKSSGSTKNFLTFLKNTPINKMIAKLPEKITATGDGAADLYLKIPFVNPEKTIVKGTYQFNNNKIIFDLPIPVLNNVNGELGFTNNGVSADLITANALDANTLIKANTNSNGIIHFDIIATKLNYNNTLRFYLPTFAPIVDGYATTVLTIDITNQGLKKISATSDLENVTINAPKPLHKKANTSKHLVFNMISNQQNNGFNINFNYANLLLGDIILNNKGNVAKANLNIGDIPNNDTDIVQALINVHSNFTNFYFLDWLKTSNSITRNDITSNSATSNSTNTANKHTNSQRGMQYTRAHNNISTFPISISLYTDNFYISNTNLGNAYAATYITPNIIAFNLNSNLMNGYGVYQTHENNLNLFLNYVHIANDYKKNNSNESHINNKTNYINNYAHELNNTSIESIDFKKLFETEKTKAQKVSLLETTPLTIPSSKINAKQIYYNGSDIGSLNLSILSKGSNLIIQSSTWISLYSQTNFNGTNYCANCSIQKSLVDLNTNIKTSDLGKYLNNLKFEGILEGGSGTIQLQTQWRGTFADFNLKSIATIINLDITNGKFLKVDTGNLLGSIIGIISLQSIVNLAKFNFNSIFSNGFTFNTLNAKAYLFNNELYLKYLYMSSTLAAVGLRGYIDLNNNELNLYLSITPHVGIGVAVGAAIITFNPLVGIATYIAEILLRNPVNKLFAFSFHITGNVKNPNITQISASKQIQHNINSTVGQ